MFSSHPNFQGGPERESALSIDHTASHGRALLGSTFMDIKASSYLPLYPSSPHFPPLAWCMEEIPSSSPLQTCTRLGS